MESILDIWEWLIGMRKHSCPNCEHGLLMDNLDEVRLPMVCINCNKQYDKYMIDRNAKKEYEDGT